MYTFQSPISSIISQFSTLTKLPFLVAELVIQLDSVEFMLNQKGGVSLIVDGYCLYKERTTSKTTVWRCKELRNACTVQIIQYHQENVFRYHKRSNIHNHAPNRPPPRVIADSLPPLQPRPRGRPRKQEQVLTMPPPLMNQQSAPWPMPKFPEIANQSHSSLSDFFSFGDLQRSTN